MSQWSFTQNLHPLPHTWWYVDRWTEWYAKPSAVTPEPKKVTWVDESAKQHHDEVQFLHLMHNIVTEPAKMTINRFHEPHLWVQPPFEHTWREDVRHRCGTAVSESPGYGITWSDLAQVHKECLKAGKKTWELCDRLTRPPTPPLSPESSGELTQEPVCARVEVPESPTPKKRVIWPDKDKSFLWYKRLDKKSWREKCQLRERWRRFQKEREETRARFLFRPGPGPIDRAFIWLRIKILKSCSLYPPATSSMKSCLKEMQPRFTEPTPRPGPSNVEPRAATGSRYCSGVHLQIKRPQEA